MVLGLNIFSRSSTPQERRKSLLGVPKQPLTPRERRGASSVPIYGGYIQTREKDPRLSGTQKYTTYSNNLANVSIVSAGVRLYLDLVSKATWRVEPAVGSGAEGAKIAELVEDILHDMKTPWHRVVRSAAMYRFYGFALLEWVAKRRKDGAIGFLDVERRSQSTIERWDTNFHGDVLGAVQRVPQTSEEVYIPREKLVYVTDDSLHDSPEGLGLFRHLVEPCRRLLRFQQLEGFGYEGNMRGVPIFRAPITELEESGKTTEDIDALLKPFNDAIENHIKNPGQGFLLDSQTYETTDESQRPSAQYKYDASLMDGGTYEVEHLGDAVTRIQMEIARILAVEQLLLGADKGSMALSKDKSHQLGLRVESGLNELCETFEHDLIGPLAQLNGWPPELTPTLATDTSASMNMEDALELLSVTASAGVTISRKDEALRVAFTRAGLPPLRPEDELDVSLMAEEPVEGLKPADNTGDPETLTPEGDREEGE